MMADARDLARRDMLSAAAAFGASAALVTAGGLLVPAYAAEAGKGEKKGSGGEQVTATEDLMREHGVLRRTLIVYAELARRLPAHPDAIDPAALADAARLFRDFGENYHEHLLEEQYLFPEVRQAGGENAKLVEVLLRQHQRGRETTDYLLSVGRSGSIGTGEAEPLGSALASMVRMYQAHAAWEDTVIFPAWKKMQSKSRLDELAEKFEQIERQQFGKDGFDDAVQRISRIEQTLGLASLDDYTAPPPSGK